MRCVVVARFLIAPVPLGRGSRLISMRSACEVSIWGELGNESDGDRYTRAEHPFSFKDKAGESMDRPNASTVFNTTFAKAKAALRNNGTFRGLAEVARERAELSEAASSTREAPTERSSPSWL